MKSVLHCSSGETDKISELLGNMKNLREDDTVEAERIVVVLNGDAVKFAEKDSSAADFFRDEVENGVELKVCSNSIEGREIEESDLVEGCEVVSSGVGELSRLQDSGFGYIKP
jgi:intracellular sulfur oxidation DsrE/DsrF family protein